MSWLPSAFRPLASAAYLHEIETLNRLWEKVPPREVSAPRARNRPRRSSAADIGPTPGQWEEVLALRMLPQVCRTDLGVSCFPCRSVDEESFSLYSHLAGSFRSGALAELLGNTIQLLLLVLGKEALKDSLTRMSTARRPLRSLRTRRFNSGISCKRIHFP